MHLRSALELLHDPPRRADAALALTRALVVTEGATSAVRVLDSSVAELDGESALRVGVARMSLAFSVKGRGAAMAEMKQWSTLGGDTPTERLALATAALARAFDPRAAASDALAPVRRALADDVFIAEHTADAPQFGNALYVLLLAEDLDAADHQTTLAFADARARGSTFAFLTASLHRSMSTLQRGELMASIAHADAALSTWPELTRTLIAERWCSKAVLNLVDALLQRGDADRADEVLAEWVDVGDLDSAEFGLIRVARGMVAHADHEPEAALEDFLGYGEIANRFGYEERTTPWRLHAAQAASALGRDEQAQDIANEAIAIARVWGTPGGLGTALRVRALVGDPRQARERLAEAVTLLERSSYKLEQAKANHALGVALLRSGLRTDGRELLRRALDCATRCGARPLAQATHAELRIAGARPRRLMFSGIESLTASEQRVARLAAAEMTNRQIAQHLFVTPKTVESHLSNVYRKLGIRSRTELPRFLKAPRGAGSGTASSEPWESPLVIVRV